MLEDEWMFMYLNNARKDLTERFATFPERVEYDRNRGEEGPDDTDHNPGCQAAHAVDRLREKQW